MINTNKTAFKAFNNLSEKNQAEVLDLIETLDESNIENISKDELKDKYNKLEHDYRIVLFSSVLATVFLLIQTFILVFFDKYVFDIEKGGLDIEVKFTMFFITFMIIIYSNILPKNHKISRFSLRPSPRENNVEIKDDSDNIS